MKSVIVDIKKNSAAFLQEDGVVVKKKGENYSIGDVVVMNEKTVRKRGKLKFATVAALFLVLIGAGTVAYASPYYYVSMDVNPSILLKVNAFNRVIGVQAVNEDAAAVVEQLEVKNKNVDDAICSAVAQLEQAGYITAESGEIMISTACASQANAEKFALRAQNAAQGELNKNQLQNRVYTQTCNREMVKEAAQYGISPGKLNIIKNLLNEQVGDNANESIQSLIKRYQAAKKAGDCDQTQDNDCDQTQDQTQTQTQDRVQDKDGTGDNSADTGASNGSSNSGANSSNGNANGKN